MNSKVDVRMLLASFWICHFLLWTFGDMLSLLQQTTEPITETMFLIVAPTLAIAQTLMVVISLKAEPKYLRLTTLIVSLIFLLINMGYLVEYSEVWNYILGIAYVLFNLLIIWNAWKLPLSE